MRGAAVGVSTAYPSMASVCELARSLVNADAGVSTTPDVMANTQPFMLPFLAASVRDLAMELKIAGSLMMVKDEVVAWGLPATHLMGQSTGYLGFEGYFDGKQMHAGFALPSDLTFVRKVWARRTGTNGHFLPLSSVHGRVTEECFEGPLPGWYEWRENRLWFDAGIVQMDLQLRYDAVFPDVLTPGQDFTQLFIPITGCLNAVAYKMVAKYAFRQSPAQFAMAKQEAKEYTDKLKAELILNSQA